MSITSVFSRAIPFTKMHGAGNDFIIINNINEKLPLDCFPALAKKLCAFHTSVGADGLMAVVPAANGGDYGMLFYNSDGSLGEMCGNGARCICRYGYENALAGDIQRVETSSGTVIGERIDERRYRIRLNSPTVMDTRHVSVDGVSYECGYVELGTPGLPHAVVFFPELESIDSDVLRSIGRKLRHAPEFPKGANVSFVKPIGNDTLKIITFERGVEDFTLACGTGCGSAVSVLTLAGIVGGKDVKLLAPGGELSVSVTEKDGKINDIYLTGSTNIVCTGELYDEDI